MTITLESLLKAPKRFILAGGKGGTGKTSVSSSLAILFAERGNRTLLVSTDPAHSIGDAFAQDFSGGVEMKVENVNGDLYALEIDSSKSAEEFQRIMNASKEAENADGEPGEEGTGESGGDLSSALSSFGLEDIAMDFQESTPPGVDEAIALAKVVEFIDDSDYDVVVFDTAPTGHTLRLLSLPDFLDSFLGKLLKLRVRISNTLTMFKSLLGSDKKKDDTVERLEFLKEHIIRVREMLRDDENTEFIIVSIPTLLSVYESERLLGSLREQGIPSSHMIVNMIMPENPACKMCTARFDSQKDSLEYLRHRFNFLQIKEIEYQNEEIRGINRLRNFGQALTSSES